LPDKAFLTTMYIKLCNYFQIAYGEGINEEFMFNLNHFCHKYDFPTLKTFNAMRFLDGQGIITLSQEFSEKITLQFIIPSKEVIRYTSLNPNDEEIILTILRTYPGVYEMQTAFNLSLIAKKSNHSEATILAVLHKLKDKEIIEYHSKNNDAVLIFNEIREDERTINKVSKHLVRQNELKKEQLQSVLKYASDKNTCKSKMILDYFGEKATADCGICSYCITKAKPEKDFTALSKKIIALLQNEGLSSREIQNKTKNTANDVIFVLQQLLEDDFLIIQKNNKYTLKT
jgi:ATP-dependent DNA helicase RecQ